MKNLALFITATILGGFGGFLGSVLGAFFSRQGLFVGAFIGGLILAPVSAVVARWRGWIEPARFWPVATGAAAGFLAAALIIVNSKALSNPVYPLSASALTGLGALLGARYRSK